MTTQFSLSSLNGANGFGLFSNSSNDQFGTSVGGDFDFNGDGVSDIIVGTNASMAYIFYGKSTPFGKSYLPQSLNGTEGVVIQGPEGPNLFANSVSGLGDVNNDGYDDVVIGSSDEDVNGLSSAGKAYVIFGGPSVSSPIVTEKINLKTGIVISGAAQQAQFGYIVSGAKNADFNGDGISDFAVSAQGANNNAGQAFIFYGSKNFTSNLSTSDLNGANGITIDVMHFNYIGGPLAVGNFNCDKYSDLIFGAPGANNDQGIAYVIFGQDNLPSLLKLSNLDGTNGFSVSATNDQGWFGGSVGNGKDINKDGCDDIILAAQGGTWGDAILIYGKPSGYSASYSYEHGALISTDSFIMQTDCLSYDPYSGRETKSVGDINDDGFADILYGAPGGFAPTNFGFDGAGYVLFGSNSLNGTRNDMCSIDNGFSIAAYQSNQNEHVTWSSAAAGDVNGDGVDDMLIGAPCFYGGGGEAFVVFGSMFLGDDASL